MRIPFLVVIWWKIIPFASVDYNDQALMHESVEIRWSSKGTVKSMYFAEFKFPSNEFAKKIKKQVLTYETMKIPFLVVIWWKIIPFA